jgi:outer membrane protein assembly factor BamD (BamD/ComL family)
MKHLEAVISHYNHILPEYDTEQATQEELEIMYRSPEGWYIRAREMGKAVLSKLRRSENEC